MPYNRIAVSSGHGKYVRGAAGYLDEVDEARKVVNEMSVQLRTGGIDAVVFHDDTSRDQNTNLNTIVNWHNSQMRDLDISVHFNAHHTTSDPMGTEVCFLSQDELAATVSAAIASVGFKDRGGKRRDDLFFLNQTNKPSILIETCFVDSKADSKIYLTNFNVLCNEIAIALGAGFEGDQPIEMSSEASFTEIGPCSHFGGPDDHGVSPDEPLAFYTAVEQRPELFLPFQPEGTTGLARRLNPYVAYVACRWDYNKTSKEMLRQEIALVRAVKTGYAIKAFPADWGPHDSTGRIADLSPGLMDALGLETDEAVEVVFPYMKEGA